MVTPKGEFELFWSAYPHKVSKGHARKAFQAAIRKVDLETMLAAINLYVATKPSDRPYCNPATWLNGERWNDEPGLVKPKRGVFHEVMIGAEAAAISHAAKRATERKIGRPLTSDEEKKIQQAALVRAEAKEILEQREHARLVAPAVQGRDVIDAFNGIDLDDDPADSPVSPVVERPIPERHAGCAKRWPHCSTRWTQTGLICSPECRAAIPDYFPRTAEGA